MASLSKSTAAYVHDGDFPRPPVANAAYYSPPPRHPVTVLPPHMTLLIPHVALVDALLSSASRSFSPRDRQRLYCNLIADHAEALS